MYLQVSERVRVTDAPIIVKTRQFIGSRQDVLSLAQGVLCPSDIELLWRTWITISPEFYHRLPRGDCMQSSLWRLDFKSLMDATCLTSNWC